MATNAFVLKSVELQNWKTFTDATLEVETEGLTGIVGKNGSGKSSFVEAILWCLYGTRPDGVLKGDLRRRGIDPSKDTTSVKVTFQHAGQTIEVFRQMKGKNHTVTGSVFLNGDDVTRVTGSTVEAWILNRLGMDSAGFTTAVVVPQKELDAIVDMKPMDRRKSIERLAGIEEMNLAVQNARARENELSKEVKMMPGSEEEVEQAESFASSVELELNRVSGQLDDARQQISEAQTELTTATTAANTAQAKMDEAVSVHSNLKDLRSENNLALQEVTSLTERVNETKAEVGDVDTSQHESLRQEFQTVSAEVTRLQEEFSAQKNRAASLENEQARLERENQRIQTELADATEDLKSVEQAAADGPTADTLSAEVTTLSQEIDELTSEQGKLRSRIADMEESIQALSGASSHCPTCKSDLDDPGQLVEKFNKMVEEMRSELEQANARAHEAKQALSTTRKSERDLQDKSFAIETQRQNVERISTTLQNNADALEQVNKAISELPDLDETKHKSAVSELEERKSEITQQGMAIKYALKAKEKLSQLEMELDQAKQKSSHLPSKIAETEAELESYGDLGALDMYVRGKVEAAERLRAEHQSLFATMKDLESTVNTLTERLSHAEAALTQEQQRVQAKASSVALLESQAATTDLLDEYRKERIARIAPELSTTATDMISQMTNGRFIEVKVADDFATSVVQNDGTEYGVSELSGGEKSIVALALRIAIGSLITGDSAGLLWLDEVLPAQDVERREAVLSVIRDLPIQQVIMINHTHEAEDVVDRVVRVNYSPDGSTVTTEQTLEDQVEEAL